MQPDGTYALLPDQAWGPLTTDWRYPETLNADFFSNNISGAQQLPNGNILIATGRLGCDILEVNMAKKKYGGISIPLGPSEALSIKVGCQIEWDIPC